MKPLFALACLALMAGSARAEDGSLLTGTLKAIKDRGSIVIGYRTNALPFAFLNKAGQPIGFSLDICRNIAEDVAALLNTTLVEPGASAGSAGLHITYVPVAADERLPKIISGAIDLECGSTTANAERAKTVAFSPVFFLAGTKLMVQTGAFTSYNGLAGHTVVAGAGTTNAAVMKALAGKVSPPIKVVETPGLDAAYDMLATGKADAFASDDILLYGFQATHPDGKKFSIVGEFLSFEPYAITLRRDDPAFSELVKATFERMSSDGSLGQLYNRWFTDRLPTGETLNLPISPELSQMYEALGRAD